MDTLLFWKNQVLLLFWSSGRTEPAAREACPDLICVRHNNSSRLLYPLTRLPSALRSEQHNLQHLSLDWRITSHSWFCWSCQRSQPRGALFPQAYMHCPLTDRPWLFSLAIASAAASVIEHGVCTGPSWPRILKSRRSPIFASIIFSYYFSLLSLICRARGMIDIITALGNHAGARLRGILKILFFFRRDRVGELCSLLFLLLFQPHVFQVCFST
jgi:hypothetical protein